MYGNKYSDQLLPLLTPEMLTRYPDQTCDVLNKLIRLAQKSSTTTVEGGGSGNLENIVQTSTSYADGGVNIVTAYLSDGSTEEFQIRNGHQGSQGDPGTPGAPGEDGQDATVAVGTTTTLPAGSSATVTNTGTASAAVFNFGIPKGDKGDNGDPGAAAIVSVGSTSTLPAGSSATVINSGTSSAAVFDFGIPKGDTGDTGAPGADGADGFSPIANVTKSGDTATITITDENGTTTASIADGTDGAPGQAATVTVGTTTTLPAGSSASVVNSGTSSAAVFDFSIPKGDTGAAGQDGADGADGFSPIATVSKVGDTATITITDENGTTTASVTDGSDGAPGAAATIAVGTTTTLSPGSSATVTNSGTSSAAVFDFGIPQGATGSPGADGADGADGFSPIATVTKSGDTATISITDANGTTTATVTDGANGSPGPANTLSIGTVTSGATADATITGTSPNQTLNLTLPKGDTGTAATVSVGTTTTLPAGSSATVTNSGTSSAAVFNFGVPKGDTGAPGQDSFVPDLATLKAEMLDIVYPVGSIYMSTNNVSPQSFLGGTWVAIEDTFLLAAGSTYTAGDTGGSATHSHTLSNNGFAKLVLKSASKIVYRETNHPDEPWTSNYQESAGGGSSASTNEHYGTDLGGKTDDATTLPPYLAVYCWKRTS